MCPDGREGTYESGTSYVTDTPSGTLQALRPLRPAHHGPRRHMLVTRPISPLGPLKWEKGEEIAQSHMATSFVELPLKRWPVEFQALGEAADCRGESTSQDVWRLACERLLC